MIVPLAAAWVFTVREYQAGLWTLKSPMTILSPCIGVEKKVKSGHKLGETGGVRRGCKYGC